MAKLGKVDINKHTQGLDKIRLLDEDMYQILLEEQTLKGDQLKNQDPTELIKTADNLLNERTILTKKLILLLTRSSKE